MALNRDCNTAAPSMNIEPGYILPYNLGQADYPESAYTAAGREALFSHTDAAVQDAYAYGSMAVQVVTWDYASPFLYARPELTPYPYVLQG